MNYLLIVLSFCALILCILSVVTGIQAIKNERNHNDKAYALRKYVRTHRNIFGVTDSVSFNNDANNVIIINPQELGICE